MHKPDNEVSFRWSSLTRTLGREGILPPPPFICSPHQKAHLFNSAAALRFSTLHNCFPTRGLPLLFKTISAAPCVHCRLLPLGHCIRAGTASFGVITKTAPYELKIYHLAYWYLLQPTTCIIFLQFVLLAANSGWMFDWLRGVVRGDHLFHDNVIINFKFYGGGFVVSHLLWVEVLFFLIKNPVYYIWWVFLFEESFSQPLGVPFLLSSHPLLIVLVWFRGTCLNSLIIIYLLGL